MRGRGGHRRTEPVSEEFIRYKAALKGAEKALHELLLASLNYSGSSYEVKELITKFNNDFEKFEQAKTNNVRN